MEHRRLGRSGLKVSVLSFGSWVRFGSQLDVGRASASTRTSGYVLPKLTDDVMARIQTALG